MSENKINVITKRAYRPRTTDSRHNMPVAPNRVDRDFSAPTANRVWCGDITYLRSGGVNPKIRQSDPSGRGTGL